MEHASLKKTQFQKQHAGHYNRHVVLQVPTPPGLVGPLALLAIAPVAQDQAAGIWYSSGCNSFRRTTCDILRLHLGEPPQPARRAPEYTGRACLSQGQAAIGHLTTKATYGSFASYVRLGIMKLGVSPWFLTSLRIAPDARFWAL